MERMPHLVRDGEHVVCRFLIIEEHEGMKTVDADRICAALLALRLADVDPALVAALFEEPDILLAEARDPSTRVHRHPRTRASSPHPPRERDRCRTYTSLYSRARACGAAYSGA